MKFPTRRVTLPPEEFGTSNTGEELWVVVPANVKEGFAKKVKDMGEDDPDGRKANAEILRLVEDWNLDNDVGEKLPLVKDLKGDVKKVHGVIEEVPVTLFTWLARTVTQQTLNDGTLGNLRT